MLALKRGSGVGRTFAFFMVPASEVQDGCDRVMTVCSSGDKITTAVLVSCTDRIDCKSVEIPRHKIYSALNCNANRGVESSSQGRRTRYMSLYDRVMAVCGSGDTSLLMF